MTSNLHSLPRPPEPTTPAKPVFSAQYPDEQRIQVEQGLSLLLSRPGPPVVFRRGSAMCLPRPGLGVRKARREEIKEFIHTYFDMVDISVATRRNPSPPYKRRPIQTTILDGLMHNCPEFVPEIHRSVNLPTFVELEDDDLGEDYGSIARRLHLISQPGYDARAKIMYSPSSELKHVDFSKDQFSSPRAAYEFLRHELLADCLVGPRDIPTAIEANEAALLAALVTPALKDVVGLTPGFMFWAQSQSAGKTFFAGVVESIYTGNRPVLLSWKNSETENEWGISVRLENESPVVILDNLKDIVKSGLLDMLITSDVVQLRSVGSAAKSYNNRTVWFLTANNPQLDRDALLRFLPIQFRQHNAFIMGNYTHTNIFNFIRENRHRILGAIYQIIRAGEAWHDTSELQSSVQPTWGKFPIWTARMAHICEAVGLKNFLSQGTSSIAESLEDQHINQLLKGMFDTASENWTTDKIIEFINNARRFDPGAFNQLPFLVSFRQDNEIQNGFDSQKFGQWVRSYGPMDHAGLKIEMYRSHGRTLYKVGVV